MGRVAPFQTNLECARGGDVKRLGKDASEFKTDGSPSRWSTGTLPSPTTILPRPSSLSRRPRGPTASGRRASFSSEQWSGEGQKPDDDKAGSVYKARLAYLPRTLAPNETATLRIRLRFSGRRKGTSSSTREGDGLRSAT